MALADRYGLPVSTSSAVALERYQDGMDNLLAYGLDGERSFAEAVAADERLALAHAGGALLAFMKGDGAAAKTAIARAGDLVGGATRRERQHVEALSALMAGETARGLALVDAHLKEFPATRSSSIRPAAPSASAGARIARSFATPSSSASPRPTATTGGFSPRWLSRITRRGASTSPGGCPSARSSSIPAMPMRATISPISASRPRTMTAAWHSSSRGWPAMTVARRFTATSRGISPCSSCTAAGRPARSRSTSATSWAATMPAWR